MRRIGLSAIFVAGQVRQRPRRFLQGCFNIRQLHSLFIWGKFIAVADIKEIPLRLEKIHGEPTVFQITKMTPPLRRPNA
jgi:hypothetical protein